jgi:hypothetical protein
MRVIAALAFVILAGALAIAALHGEGQSPNTSTPSQPAITSSSSSTPSAVPGSSSNTSVPSQPAITSSSGGTPTAVPGGSPSAVPAGTGGLAARHEGGAAGWEIALVVGVALAAAGAVIALRSRDNDVGSRRRVRVSLAAASSVAGMAFASVAAACCLISQTDASDRPHAFGDSTERPAQAGTNRQASAPGGTADRPAMLALPSVDVTAPVIAVGVSEGDLQVPDDPGQVGWWVSSAEAGADTGSVIMDGHVDTASGGPGALYRMGIGKLHLGDRVIVTTMLGRNVSYRIYAQSVYVKAAGLPADIFAASQEPRLVLITCGGAFDSDGKSYVDNVVVYARPTQD